MLTICYLGGLLPCQVLNPSLICTVTPAPWLMAETTQKEQISREWQVATQIVTVSTILNNYTKNLSSIPSTPSSPPSAFIYDWLDDWRHRCLIELLSLQSNGVCPHRLLLIVWTQMNLETPMKIYKPFHVTMALVNLPWWNQVIILLIRDKSFRLGSQYFAYDD